MRPTKERPNAEAKGFQRRDPTPFWGGVEMSWDETNEREAQRRGEGFSEERANPLLGRRITNSRTEEAEGVTQRRGGGERGESHPTPKRRGERPAPEAGRKESTPKNGGCRSAVLDLPLSQTKKGDQLYWIVQCCFE